MLCILRVAFAGLLATFPIFAPSALAQATSDTNAAYADLIRAKGFNCPTVQKIEDFRQDHYGRVFKVTCHAPAAGYADAWAFRVTRKGEGIKPQDIDVKPW